FRFLLHLLDFFVCQTGRSFDSDLLFLTGALVFGRHVQDTVGVDIECYFDLRNSARCRRDPVEVETSDRAVVLRHWPLTLQDMDLHRGLIVCRRREDLRFLRRNRRVGLDQLREYTPEGFNTQRKRCYIQQQHIFHFTGEYTPLDRSTDCHHFVRVYAFRRLLAKEFLHFFLDSRDTGGTPDENHFINLANTDARILYRLAAGFKRSANQIVDELFEFRPADFLHQVLRYSVDRSYVREVYLRFLRA